MHSMMFGCPVITHNNFNWQMPEYEAIKPGITGDFFKMDDVSDLVKQSIVGLQKIRQARKGSRSLLQ